MDYTLATQSLMELGLTSLEAQIYTFLLQQSPATGYRVAKAVGKPVANVYKALQTLETKGAIEVDRGKIRMVRAVPVEELLELLAGRFRRHRNHAADTLKHLPGPTDDTRIYQFRDRDQVFEKCRQLIRSAESIVLLDIFPKPLVELKRDIEAASQRGLTVEIKAYQPFDLAGIEVILEPDHERIRSRWPAQWINLVTDGSEMLLALLDKDAKRVIQAVWSSSPFLAWIGYSGLVNEIALTYLRQHAQRLALDADGGPLQRLYERFLEVEAPGYTRLRRQCGVHVDDLIDLNENQEDES
jgi:sugar-specific transcriptional regulator TrmB